MTTQFAALQEAVVNANIHYLSVDFPITHEGKGVFKSANGVVFRFSVDGAGYLSERNTRYRFKDFTRPLREGRFDDLALLANEAIHPIKGAGLKLIFAMYGEFCVGILRQYNIVEHKTLLSALDEAGLAKDVRWWTVNSNFMTCDVITRIHGTVEDDNEFSLGLRITNGHSGHNALRYQLFIKAKSYEFAFSAPEFGRSRHLTGVSVLVANLKHAMYEVGQAKIDETLRRMTSWEFINLIHTHTPTKTARQDMLIHLIENAEVVNGLDVVCHFGQFASTKGYGTAVATLIDPVLKKLLEK